MFDLIEIAILITSLILSLFLLKGVKELKSSGKIYTVKQQIYFSEQLPSSKKKNRNNFRSNKPDRNNSDSYDEDEDYLPFG